MRRIPSKLMPHGGLVAYRALTGQGSQGAIFTPAPPAEPAVPRRACIVEKRRLIRGADGREVVSSARVWLDPEHLIEVGSKVTIWRGMPNERTAVALGVTYHQHPGLPTHVQLDLE